MACIFQIDLSCIHSILKKIVAFRNQFAFGDSQMRNLSLILPACVLQHIIHFFVWMCNVLDGASRGLNDNLEDSEVLCNVGLDRNEMQLQQTSPIHALFILRRVTSLVNTRSVKVSIQEKPQISGNCGSCLLTESFLTSELGGNDCASRNGMYRFQKNCFIYH